MKDGPARGGARRAAKSLAAVGAGVPGGGKVAAQRADDMTDGVTSGGAVRRGLLGGLAASALAGLTGHLGGGAAARKRRKKKPLCKRCPKICEGRRQLVTCRPLSPGASSICVCARKTNDKVACVGASIGSPTFCSETDQCQVDNDCDAGEVCIKTIDDGICCPAGQAGNLCVAECDGDDN